ncbi:hypothetical protein UlMin_012798 [Ulmus minor]
MAKHFSYTFLYTFLFINLYISNALISSQRIFNVLSFGAVPNGIEDSTLGFLNAWSTACASIFAAEVYIPKGRFLVRPLAFNGSYCRSPGINFRIEGTLVAPTDYRVLGWGNKWLSFQKVTGVSIIGGTLEAGGHAFWDCKRARNIDCHRGAVSLRFTGSRNIRISGLTSLNSQVGHISIKRCRNVHIKGVRVIAADNSPNTEGIHVQQSQNVVIEDSSMQTGDDCISIGPGTKNLWIENIACGPGHGISIGSLGKGLKEEGVQNVTVKKATITGTQNGLRIKAWARPSNGFVHGVHYVDVIMQGVRRPIVIDQNYCPHKINCPGQQSGTKISDVVYQNIRGTSATAVAVKFDCSRTNPCAEIRLRDVNLKCLKQPARSSCANVNGTVFGVIKPNSCF